MRKISLLLLVTCVAFQTFATTYYNKIGQTALGTIGNWTTSPDGVGGTSATGSFSTGNVYIIRNGTSGVGGTLNVTGAWILAAGAKLQIGNDTNTINVSLAGALTLASTTTVNVMSSDTLNITNTTTLTANASNFNNAASSVVYYSKAAGGQTIAAGTYGSLFLTNGSGTQTAVAGSAIIVNGGLTITAGTLVMGTTRLGGTCSPFSFNATLISTTCTVNPALPQGKDWSGGGVATVSYLGTTTAQFVPGGTFNNLTFANTTGAVTVTGNLVVDGTFQTASNAAGVIDLQTYTLGGLLSTLTLQNNLKTASLTPAIPAGRNWASSTNSQVTFTSLTGRQQIPDGTYNKLTCLNTSDTNFVLGDLTFTGATSAIFTTTGGASGVLNMGVNTFTSAFTITNNGTLVTRNTSSTPIISGKTYAGTVCFCEPTGGQSIPAGTYSGTLVIGNTSGTSTATGNIAPASLTVAAGGTFDMTSAYKITGMAGTTTINGTLQSAALLTPFVVSKTWDGTGKVVYNGTGTQNIMGGTYNCKLEAATVGTASVTAALAVNNELIVGASTSFDMNTFQMTSTGTPTISNSGPISTSYTSAAALPAGLNWGNTVTFARTNGAQTVPNGTYNNLLMANTTGTVTATGDLTVNGTLTTGFALNMGTGQLLGTLSAINVGGAILTSCTVNPALPTGRDWSGITTGTAASVTFAAATGGQYIPQGTYRTLNCTNTSGTDTVLGDLVINTGTVTATVKTTASGTLNMQTYALSSVGTGTLSISNSGTLMTQNTSATPIPTGKNFGGTVMYNAPSGAQTVVADTYSILTIANVSGTNNAGGNLTVGTLNVMTADTLNMGTNILMGGLASITNDGVIKTANITTTNPVPSGKTWNGAGRLIYTSATGGQSVPGGTFNNDLQFLNSSGTNTVTAAITANGAFIVSGAGTVDLGTFALNGSPTVTLNGTLLTKSTSATPLPSGETWGGTVKFSATTGGQFIPGGTYNNLSFLNATGNNTAQGPIWVNGALVTTSGASGTLIMGSNKLGGTPTSITHDGFLTTTSTDNPAIPSGDWTGTGGSSKVTFAATTGGQYIPGGSFKTLVCSNTSGTNTVTGNLVVGSFTTTGTSSATGAALVGSIDMGIYKLTATSVTNYGTLYTQNASSAPIPTGKSWIGTVAAPKGEVVYNGTGSQTLAAGTYNNLSVINTRTGGSTLTLGSGVVADTFVINGSFNLPDSTRNSATFAAAATNTFQYAQNTNAAVAPITYNNLYFSNTGQTKTATGNVTINGTLSIPAGGATFSMDTFTLTGPSTIVNNGTIKIGSHSTTPIGSGKNWGTSGTVAFTSTTGGQYIPAGTYWKLTCAHTSGTNYANGVLNIGNDFITAGGAGGIFDLGTNQLISTGGAGSIDNPVGATLRTQNSSSTPLPVSTTFHGTVEYYGTGNQTIVGAVYRDTLLISGARTGTPTITLDATDVITISNSFLTSYTGAVNFSTTASTVKYDGAVNGAVAPITYGFLYFANGSGTKTAAGNIVVRDSLLTSAGGTFDMSTYTLSGSFTRVLNGGTFSTSSLASTPFPAGLDWRPSRGVGKVLFAAPTGGQAIPTGNYWILACGNTSGTDTAKGDLLIDTMLTTNGGILRMGSNAMSSTMTMLTAGTGTVTTTNTSSAPLVSGATWSQNVEYRKSTGGQTIQSGNFNGGLTISNTSGFNFLLPSTTVNIAGNLTLNTGSVLSDSGNTISLVGNIVGAGTHRGTGKIAMNFNAAGSESISGATLGNLELNNSNDFTLSGSPVINGTLTLTDGVVDLGNNNLSLSTSATAIGGTPGTSNMLMITGTGEVRKYFDATGSFLFPIGDNGPNYSPMTLNVTGGTFGGGAYAGVRVTDAKQPQNANTDNYLTRYWSVATSGITSPQYDISNAKYVPADVVGYESYITSAKYDGSLPWVKYDTVDSVAHTVTTGTLTSNSADISGINSNLPTISVDTVSAICGGDTAILNANGNGDNGLSYTWSPAADLSATTGSTVLATPTAAGMHIYTVTITDGNGITNTNTVQVSVNPTPDAGALTGTASVCYNATTTLANLNPGGVWKSADTLLATVDTSGVVTGVIPITWDTTVEISYRVQLGCGYSTAYRTVTINALPGVGTFVATNNHQVCVGSSVIYSETHPGGIWSTVDPAIASIDSLTGVLTGVDTGSTTISYTVTSDMGCKRARTGGITVNGVPPVPVIDSIAQVACTGNTITLTGTTGAGSVLWTSMNTDVATINPTTGVLTGVTPGTATISYTFTRKCSSSTSTVVTINATTTASVTGTTVLCASGDMVTLTGEPSGGVWSSSNTSRATVGTSSGVVTGGAASGTATISYVYTNMAGCASSVNTLVTVNPLPTVASVTGPSTACVGANATYTNSTPGGVWSSTNPAVATIGAGTGILTGVTAGTTTISYTVTGVNGCIKASKMTITINPMPTVSAIVAASDVVCQFATLSLSDTTSFGGTTSWTSSNPSVATVSGLGLVTGVSAGTTTISYNYTTGCTGRATMVVSVNPAVTPTVTASATLCANATTALSATPSGGAWTSASPSRATVGSSSGIVTGVSAGTATLSYSYTNGLGCVGVGTTLVTVNAQPSVAAILGASSLCANGTTLLTDATSDGVWSSSDEGLATVGTTGLVSGVSPGAVVISYTVTGINGCSKTSTKGLTVSNVPTVDVIVAGSGTVCSNSTLALSNATAGTHTWISDNVSAATVNSSTGLVSGVAAGTATISYNFTSGGCTNTATTVVTVNSVTTPTVTGTAVVCANGGTTMLSGSPAGGTWSSSSASMATVGTNGLVTGAGTAGNVTISYTYTNGSGCNGIALTTVTVNASPTVASITGASSLCANATTTLSNATTGGVWASANESIATVGTAGLVSGVTAGPVVISYTYTGVNGCSKTVTKSLTVNALPVVADINAGGGVVCQASTLALTDATTGTHSWVSANTGIATVNSSTGVVTGVSAGTVLISYNYTSGCTATTTTLITVNPTTTPTVTGTASVCANGGTTMLTASPVGGMWSSSAASKATVGTTGLVTGGASTGTVTISYSYTNEFGCTGLKNTVVTVNATPVVNSIAGSSSVCVGSTVAMVNGTAGGAWSSTNTSAATIGTSGVVTGVAPGTTTISYTVIGVNGCPGASTKLLTVNPTTTVAPITGPTTVAVSSTISLMNATAGGAWTSSASGTATVGTSGVVSGVAPGAVTISYTVTGCGTARATYAVTVTASKPSENIALPEANVSVYPNPTTGTFTINTSGTGMFVVYSVEGKEITRFNVTSPIAEYSMPFGTAPGVYTCKFAGDDGSTAIVRIVYKP